MSSPPTVAIVILNWNGKKFLEQFLPSVLRTTYASHKVIVADNCSTDDSITFVEQTHPDIGIVRLPVNYGFAKGYNEALKKIQADYYVLLNSDVEVDAGWLEPMIAMVQSDPAIAGVQPKILAFHEKNKFEYAGAAGGFIDKYGYPFARGRIFELCEEDHGQYDAPVPIFWASGAAMFVKADVFHEVGGFDEYFFAHQEEIDLCWRIHLAGYKLYACPASTVYHIGGGTLPKGNTRKTYLNFRNNQIMLAKNLPWSEKWWKIPFRLGLDIISAYKGLLTGEGGYFVAVLRAHLAFVRWILLAKKDRHTYRRTTLALLAGVYKHNLIWTYYVKKKKHFSQFMSAQ